MAQNVDIPSDPAIQAPTPVITLRDDTAGGTHLNKVQSHHFLRGKQTGGAYSLSEIVFQPGGEGTPLHRHHREEETYYVIEGQLEVHVGDQKTILKPGGSVLLPRGIPHKVRPVGDAVTRVLMVISPPRLVDMLIELDRLTDRGEADAAALGRLAAEYEVDFVPE